MLLVVGHCFGCDLKLQFKNFLKILFPLFFLVGESCASVMAEQNGKIWPSSGVGDEFIFFIIIILKSNDGNVTVFYSNQINITHN